MAGASMRQAKAGLLAGLARLTPRDRFNVIRFDDTWDALHPEPVPATPEALEGAGRFVAALEARGGTEMLAPLRAALADPHPEDGRVRQVVFLTDGAVGDEERIFAAIHAGLGRSRLFMVGIGSAPNGHLMRHAAEIGRGSFTEIRDLGQVAERTRALYAKLESPAVTDLAATFSAAGVAVTPGTLPDLYRGEPLVFAARLPHGAEGTVTDLGPGRRPDLDPDAAARRGRPGRRHLEGLGALADRRDRDGAHHRAPGHRGGRRHHPGPRPGARPDDAPDQPRGGRRHPAPRAGHAPRRRRPAAEPAGGLGLRQASSARTGPARRIPTAAPAPGSCRSVPPGRTSTCRRPGPGFLPQLGLGLLLALLGGGLRRCCGPRVRGAR